MEQKAFAAGTTDAICTTTVYVSQFTLSKTVNGTTHADLNGGESANYEVTYTSLVEATGSVTASSNQIG